MPMTRRLYVCACLCLVTWSASAADSMVIVARPCARPEYPKAAREAGQQGVSRVRFHIDANGNALGAEVVRSSGSHRLDKATIDALIGCKFNPQLKDGQPVESYQEIDYTWQLR
jgi:TonB family protein